MIEIRKYIVTGIKNFTNMVQALKDFKEFILFESVASWYADNLNVEE
jgi:hypothetical protein